MREFTPGWCNFNGKFRNGSLGQAFMLPIVDALNKRPSRCCSSTYPTYCVDGYQQLMPVSLAKALRTSHTTIVQSFEQLASRSPPVENATPHTMSRWP